MESDEEEYFIPLQDQRVFGAGIKRKRVTFMKASNPPPTSSQKTQNPTPVSDRYLSIVLPNPKSTKNPSIMNPSPTLLATKETTSQNTQTASNYLDAQSSSPTCPICNLPFSSSQTVTTNTPHAAFLAHQVCLTHSHPPSNLDRTRQGLKYLSSYGWDPDSRLGLGAQGEGIRIPIKGKVKNDTAGLGVKVGRRDKERSAGPTKEAEKLDAKQVRRMEEVGRRKGERLREMFYRSDDVERYLGAL